MADQPYFSLFTDAGLQMITDAIRNGKKLGITHMAFGDGNGSLPVPNKAFTELVHEVYRMPLNSLSPDPQNANWLRAEAVIASAIGGFNIRELGLYASDTLVAYSNYPPTYKPSPSDGTARIMTFRMVMQIDNTANFELVIDPDVVLATIAYVDQIAIDSKIKTEDGRNQKEVNDVTVQTVESIADLIAIKNPRNGQTVRAKSYYAGMSIGGGLFVYDSTKSNINDNVTVFNGWVRQLGTSLAVSEAGAKGGTNDDYAALQLAAAKAVALKMELLIDIDISVSQPADIPATLKVVGNGGAMQYSRSITAINDNAIFTIIGGFGSESCYFGHLQFKSKIAGTGTAFGEKTAGYLSQCIFENCIFEYSLRYGINTSIILCEFRKCDFGSYNTGSGTPKFKAIRAASSDPFYAANANLFQNCIFRHGSDDCVVEYSNYGVQWRFVACDFEQNKSTDCVIKCDGSGAFVMSGGYIEANTAPYFVKFFGDMNGFTNVAVFENVHFNNPCMTAIGKNNHPTLPRYKFEGCYGRLDCALFEDSSGLKNTPSLLSSSKDNSFSLMTNGSVGEIDTVQKVGFTSYRSKSYQDNYSINKFTITTTFAANQAKAIATLSNAITTSIPVFGGELLIVVAQGNFLGNVNYAVYKYLVSVGGVASLTLASKTGLTEGGGSAHPSFTFTLNGNALTATAVGSTSGQFAFRIIASEMISVLP